MKTTGTPAATVIGDESYFQDRMSTGKRKNCAFIVNIFELKTTLHMSTLNNTTSFIDIPGDHLLH